MWLEKLIADFCLQFPQGNFWGETYQVRGFLAIFLVALVCGSVGSLIVSKRMAFFSDALAHCSFAGVAIGLVIGIAFGVNNADFKNWIFLIMVVFGILVGLLIAYVQEKSSLPSDTVIGVFFAGAIGLGAVVMRAVRGRRFFNLETFLFGSPLDVTATDLIWLFGLMIVTALVVCRYYNTLVFASFNPSLARSRWLQVRLTQYLYVALIGLIVNLCLQIVGVLLVNAFLIVPAAAAANFSRNLRQMFWSSIIICLLAGWGGQILSWEVRLRDPLNGQPIEFGVGGLIVLLCVLFFIVSLALGPMLKNRQAAVS
ncbi:MAG: metal ABC transporter permease [Planctomycetes bacterium]|nr:metal ABC transporter permease [Planctomycetota bacterium]